MSCSKRRWAPDTRCCRYREVLKDLPGNLLILYGDTPLFRPDSIRGLLNRHQLQKADLTLLTANVERPLPYGRIIRDAAGQIIDIIEDAEASPDVRQIHELNVGAYVVNAGVIAVALESLTPSPRDGEYRLTDCVHQLIRSGLRVTNYQLYDQDEVQGINTPRIWNMPNSSCKSGSSARTARKKRTWSPSEPAAGAPSSARASPCTTSAASARLWPTRSPARGREKRRVLIGYDRRFLSETGRRSIREVFAGNNIPTILSAKTRRRR
jgi:hypothetical protein